MLHYKVEAVIKVLVKWVKQCVDVGFDFFELWTACKDEGMEGFVMGTSINVMMSGFM